MALIPDADLTGWNEFVAWYDGRRTYGASDRAMLALDRRLILIAAAGYAGWPLFAAEAGELRRRYDAATA